jgi:hypothetical protein
MPHTALVLPTFALAAFVACIDGVAVSACAADATPPSDGLDPLSGSVWVEGDAGHDSNPTVGGVHALVRTHGPPDYFLEEQAEGKATLPLYPNLDLVLKSRVDDRDYQGDLPEDSDLIHSEVQLPLKLGTDTELVPYGWVEDQWYGHDYYSTEQRGAIRWTQHWTLEWDTDLVPYLERDRYRPPNRYQDLTMDGVDADVTWWVPGKHWLMAVTLSVGGALADARAVYASFKQDDINLDQLWTLPAEIRADLDLDWSPTYYEGFAPGTHKLRLDRTFTGNLHLQRPLMRWLIAEADATLTSDHSNFPADQYHEIVLSIGLRITFN